jgi:hypothetical protein
MAQPAWAVVRGCSSWKPEFQPMNAVRGRLG